MRALAQKIGSLVIGAACVACGGLPNVTRIVDGHVIEGPFVEPEAYAAFLRGAMAEERGDLPSALREYESILSVDDDNAEIWTRIGAVRCRVDPRDKIGARAIVQALKIDAEYAAAWEVRARCGYGVADDPGAPRFAASRAAALDPRAASGQIALASLEAKRREPPGAARERLVAITLRTPSSSVGWRALGTWARAHRDAVLAARAYGELARLSEESDDDVAQVVLELAGEGELWSARTLAGALLDARRERDRESPTLGLKARRLTAGGPVVARLAVDDALARSGDADRARRRGVSAHLAGDVVAARALLLGRADLALALAQPIVQADPRAVGARLVLAAAAYDASARDDALALLRASFPVDAPPSPEGRSPKPSEDAAALAPEPLAPDVLLAFLQVIARTSGAGAARAIAERFPVEAWGPGDEPLVSLGVALARAGALPVEMLPADGRIELAVRSGQPPPASIASVDARHRLLAFAWSHPTAPETRTLFRRVGAAWPRDSLVAAATARLAMAGAVQSDASTPARIAAVDPTDPWLAELGIQLAQKRGDEAAARALRARLTALAAPPISR